MTEVWERLVVSSLGARTVARPPEHQVSVETGLRVPMRDGTRLEATLWLSATPGRYPVLVERGPQLLQSRTGPAGEYYAARGYAVLGVNLRGSRESEGDFRGPMPGAPAGDGYDTGEWAAGQEWSNGRVGMLCVSWPLVLSLFAAAPNRHCRRPAGVGVPDRPGRLARRRDLAPARGCPDPVVAPGGRR
jgi:predicted acyl esterase